MISSICEWNTTADLDGNGLLDQSARNELSAWIGTRTASGLQNVLPFQVVSARIRREKKRWKTFKKQSSSVWKSARSVASFTTQIDEGRVSKSTRINSNHENLRPSPAEQFHPHYKPKLRKYARLTCALSRGDASWVTSVSTMIQPSKPTSSRIWKIAGKSMTPWPTSAQMPWSEKVR